LPFLRDTVLNIGAESVGRSEKLGGGNLMFEAVTQKELRAQIEQHLLMVEEVLGGLDQFVQGLERRIARIEEGLGIEPEGFAASGWIAELQKLKSEISLLRKE
jgi:hypothetical protein